MTDLRTDAQGASWRSALVYVAWAQALVATLGSLFFSEVMRFTPCVLCWYQRIFMYPLLVILTVGVLDRDPRIRRYVLPLSVLGLLVSVFHNLLFYGVIPEEVTQCRLGVSCTIRYFDFAGFIDIPQMSLVAFTVITVAMLLYRPKESDDVQ
ncbi:MAG TPA: disulfide oxidoreductase [Candidatus Binatia bacterium]|nr:disulfide oxidoreductase [Candidatus Binatia bacterium]